MQVELGSITVFGGAALVVAIIVVVYYQFFYKREKRLQERIRSIHFEPLLFIGATKVSTFEFYDRKLRNLVFMFLVPTVAAIAGPRLLNLPSPFDAIASTLGAVIALCMTIVTNVNQRERERAQNVNKAMGSAHVLYPEIGEVPQLFKRMQLEGKIVLSEKEAELLVDGIVNELKKLPDWRNAGVRDVDLKKHYLERIKKVNVYRLRIADTFRILLITPSDYDSMKTADVHPMIDETVTVSVQQMPMFLLYAGTSTRIFKTSDDKARPAFADRVMGVFVDLFDLATRDSVIKDGKFTALTKTDALLAEYLHLFQQRSSTSTEMSKSLRDLETAKTELDENDFDAEAEANELVNSAKHLLRILSELLRQKETTRQDYGIWLLIFALGLLAGNFLLP